MIANTKDRAGAHFAPEADRRSGLVCLLTGALLLLAGCSKSGVDQALDSDANGYVCLACKARFYTDRKIFPTRCPDCKKPDIEEALGFVCQADQCVMIGPRGQRSAKCEKCGNFTTALSIPREADLKSWGAVKKTEAEVNGQ
ncbi:MAG: hypothetical protein V9H26_10060 [Verrucomicrobiota bacterium]|nr:hypothetical protein [Verrucomicrobiota bacterium]MCC6819101.1 hypothetical protein [Limisphaerales bacterium]